MANPLSLIPDGLLKAAAFSATRHLAQFVAGCVLAFFLAHNANKTDATALSEEVGAVVMALASYGWSLYDNKKVDSKIKTAAVTGSVSAANSPQTRTSVAQAGTPEALAQVLAQLKAGQE